MIFVDPKLWAVATDKPLGDYAVGGIVKLSENGSPVDYLVVHQGLPSSMYDASCDGTWLLRKNIVEKRAWDSGDSNVLETSDIQAWLNSTMLARYDSKVRSLIKSIKIPYRKNGGSGGTDQSGANGLQCKLFMLSGYEVGWTKSNNTWFPVDGSKLSYFIAGNSPQANQKRVATLNDNADNWRLRSQAIGNTNGVWNVYYDGDYGSNSAAIQWGVRHALILPFDTIVGKNNLVA